MPKLIHGEDLVLKVPEGTPTIAVLVSPETANVWLNTEVRNRPLQRASMLTYRTDMLAGRWAYTATPICFDWDGHLIDGKNRLTALASTNNPNLRLPFAVARGLDPDIQMFMDQGARRSTGQQLGLKGIKSGTAVGAGVKLVLLWEREQLFSDRWGVTQTEVIGWIEDHPEAVELCHAFIQRIRRIGLRPSSGLAFVIRVGQQLPDELDVFINELYSLENLQPGSPTLAFARRLMRVKDSTNVIMTDTDQLGFMIRTWNAWVRGKSQTNFAAPSGGFNMDNFPKVMGI